MTAADWEDPAATGFRLRTHAYEIAFDRAGRSVTPMG
jgi:hypothetical protein